SPPHIFIYAMATVSTGLVAVMIWRDVIRQSFAFPVDVPYLPFKVPGALMLLAGGFVILGFAGLVLDNFWHSMFGLDETNWSFPHAMLGWAIMVIGLGFMSARLTLTGDRPLRWWTVLIFGWLFLAITSGPIMGPLESNRSPEMVHATSEIPALAGQPEPQHTYRIYQQWNLNRTNPVLMVLAPLWLGIGVGFITKLDNRWWVILLITLAFLIADNGQNAVEWFDQQDYHVGHTHAQLASDPKNYQSLPVLIPVAFYLLARRFVSQRWALGAAGAIFSIMIFLIWGDAAIAFFVFPLAVPAVLFGRAIGERVFNILKEPDSLPRIRILWIAALVVPVFTGILDLILRAVTP
ncbi:MAG: hypothetical protein L0154_06480, partial [Chloroflexi bacterium]|nr:hypothetical protein [Chloroflexota bacterium]